ncbi:MAG: general stress protein [Nodularia sp. (in: cyanobacteria)]|nr:general stress protein [Nodularia sp. (in: cyanobacteria)]
MVTTVRRRAVGTFSNRRDAEQALHELKNSGFSMDRVSVIAKDAEHQADVAGTQVQERVGNKADEGATTGAMTGGAVGGLTGLLIGLGTLAIPGIGPIMLAGATATTLATTLAGAGIGAAAGGLLGALIGLGIPEERAKVYHQRVEQGHYLVMVEGTDTEISAAERIFNRYGIEEFGVYDYPNNQIEHLSEHDSIRRETTPVVDKVSTNDPSVVIIDRRDEKV